MHRSACTLGRALCYAFFSALLLVAPANASDAVVAADFDGDGHGDHAVISSDQPTVLRVWLSATGTTELVRSAQPLLRITAADLDGDHHAEIIATDGSPLIKIWTKQRARFRSFRPKQLPRPWEFSDSSGHAAAGRAAPSSPTTLTPRTLDGSLVPQRHVAVPIVACWQHAAHAHAPATSSRGFAPLAPRPPPVSSL